MNLKEQLQSDLKDAMRAGDELRKNTLRMAISAIKLAEIEKNSPLDESATLAIIQKEVKSRREVHRRCAARQPARPGADCRAGDHPVGALPAQGI